VQHKTKKKESHICSHFSPYVSEEGGRGFAEFGGVRAIWTKLKLHLTLNWLRNWIASANQYLWLLIA